MKHDVTPFAKQAIQEMSENYKIEYVGGPLLLPTDNTDSYRPPPPSPDLCAPAPTTIDHLTITRRLCPGPDNNRPPHQCCRRRHPKPPPSPLRRYFRDSELLVDITEHRLVPTHHVLEPLQKEELLKRWAGGGDVGPKT